MYHSVLPLGATFCNPLVLSMPTTLSEDYVITVAFVYVTANVRTARISELGCRDR